MKNIKRTAIKFIAAVLSAVTALSSAMIFRVFAEPAQESSVVPYTGGEVTPPVTISDEGVQLQNGVDYDLSYENNINVGTATVIVTFKGNYSGERRVNFNIIARSLTNDDVTLSGVEKQIYTGAAIEPKPEITVGDIPLVENIDYTLSYKNNISIGTATIDVTFTGNYAGSTSAAFEIVPNEFSDTDIESGMLTVTEIEAQTYTGEAITPEPSIKYGDVTLEKGKDYTLEYENNINAGTATINVSFIGNYTGTVAVDFEIMAKAVTERNVTISEIPDRVYTGSAIVPEPVVTDVSR